MNDNFLNNMNTVQNEDIDLMYYVSIIIKRIWLLIGAIVICVVGAILVNMFIQPRYKSAALLLIDKESTGRIDSSSYGSWSSDREYYGTQYKLLQSRTLLEKVYNKMDLSQYTEFKNPGGWAKLKKNINIAPVKGSRLLNVEVESYDNKLCADIANTLASMFVEENLSNRVSVAKDVIAALEATEKSAKQQELLNSLPQIVNSDFIKNLKNQEITLYKQFVQLNAKYTLYHPEVIAVQEELRAIREEIDIETKRIIQSIKINLSGQFLGNNVRLIDKAAIPSKPYMPNKLLNLLIGVGAGFVFGILLICIVEYSDRSIRSDEDLREKLNLSFLGFVPVVKIKKKEREYVTMLKGDSNFLLAEQIRNIRTMLNFALSDNRKDPFLIVSSLQGEGKSHFAVNLSVAFSQTQKKVLLVDGDLRRSRLHKVFRLSNEKGLTNFWKEDKNISSFEYNVQKTDVENLFVMTSGTRPPNPSELLNTPVLEKFIEWAVASYDTVIIDCPAVLPVSDALLWGKYIKKAVFIVRYSNTDSKLAKLSLEKLRNVGIKILGGIIAQYEKSGFKYSKYGYYKNYSYYNSYKEDK